MSVPMDKIDEQAWTNLSEQERRMARERLTGSVQPGIREAAIQSLNEERAPHGSPPATEPYQQVKPMRLPAIGRIVLLSFVDRPEPVPAIVTKVMPGGFGINCTAFLDSPAMTQRYEAVAYRRPHEKRDANNPRIPTWSWHDDE